MRPTLPKLRPASRQALAFGAVWASALDFGLAGLVLFAAVNAWAPPQDLAWKPLRLADPPGLATGIKLARAAADPALCRAVLRQGGIGFTEEPARSQDFCETRNAVRLRSGVTPLSPPAPVMACPLALGYAFWDRHALRPAASALGRPVARVDHYGTYACRRVYGRADGAPSEHARANALDVAGVRLVDGGQVTVVRHFRAEDARGPFLRQLRDGACRYFRVVLSPDYNAAHRDHLHLDAGRYRACR